MASVVTRFAPSPTGNLHIGGARTALFSWAYARRHGGRFILRFEDTDRARSSADSARRILASLRWLGLEWDEGPRVPDRWQDALEESYDPYAESIGEKGPYVASERLEIYERHIQALLDAGRAYRCFKTQAQIEAERKQAADAGQTWKYDPSEALGLDADTVASHVQEGRPHVIRFRMPVGQVTIRDEVRGDVTVDGADLEDLVIRKSDGFPTFHLAVTVDDALMGVTHVIRAQEHLANTPKHWALQEALGFDHPTYAHLSLIFNADGSKMGKRDKAKAARKAARQKWEGSEDELRERCAAGDGPPIDAGALTAFMKKKNDDVDIAVRIAGVLEEPLPEIDVSDFQESGYLSESICNYIALLGWSPGDDIEKFDLEFLVQHFGFERLVKSNARFDREKLLAFNADAIAALEPDTFRSRLHEFSRMLAEWLDAADPRFTEFARAYQPRSHTLREPEQIGAFFLRADDEIAYDPKAVSKNLTGQDGRGLQALERLTSVLDGCADWTAAALENAVKSFAASQELNMGKVAQPLRVAVSGSTVSPPIFETLYILGRNATLRRIKRCLELNGDS
ncbi:MAG: glutamate--tRNA ligase [Phycisphaeraceae bacterium]|nr:glutamate--tRNA ligase [Phycisphaeraceae bacterium]